MDTTRELAGRLASLYRNERNAMADFLIALADFDARKAWREIGYPSLWTFLRHELKLSKSAARRCPPRFARQRSSPPATW